MEATTNPTDTLDHAFKMLDIALELTAIYTPGSKSHRRAQASVAEWRAAVAAAAV